MFLSVAICTWNREKLLDQTLREMHQLRIPPGVDWELLVVNNNCTDATDAVLARHAGPLPLRRLLETRQGHSHARNCAVAAARGELLLWTDDDVLVDPEWLAEYAKAAQARPDAAYFGGTVDPWFEVEPPLWIRRHLAALEGPYVIRQHGGAVRPLAPGDTIAGASMAFRTQILQQFPFNPHLGRVKGMLTGGDDCDVLERVRQAGHQGLWVGTAHVRHFIPADRLTPSFIRRWYEGAGRTSVRLGWIRDEGPPLLGAPRWALKQYCQEALKCRLFFPFKGPRWLRALMQAAKLRGVIRECRESRHKARSQKKTAGQTSRFQRRCQAV